MNSNSHSVTVIVPVFKVEQYLSLCIESVQAQTYENWEMILVDDGSPDKCGEICDEYSAKDSRIKVIHKENGGLSSARNAGLDYPHKGEFVTFLDSDDFWHSNYLQVLVGLQQSCNADIVQCDFVRGTETSFPDITKEVSVGVYDNHEIFLSEKAKIIMCAKLYRTRLFDDIRMPVGLYNEDDWTAWKLYYKAEKIVVTNQPLYYYTVNPSSIMGQLNKKPDLRYINAYNERIGFFEGTGEKDLEHCSRLQLCKSLVLAYRHKKLSKEERMKMKTLFSDNWSILKDSPYIIGRYKLLFMLFRYNPLATSQLTNRLYGRRGG